MENTERTWTIRKLNTSEMKSTQPYQREINMARVRKAVDNFDPNKVDVVHVSFRDGKYYVIDGQHTVSILEMVNQGKPVDVVCAVHVGMTYEDEAKYYAEQYSKKSIQTAQDIAIAEYEAKTPEYINLANAVATVGARMSYDSKHKEGIKISSVKTIQKLYNKDYDNFIDSIKYLSSAYGSYEKKLYTDMISGVMSFLKLYKDNINFNGNRLIEVLSKTDQQAIRDSAKNRLRSDIAMTSPKNWIETIRCLYNQKLSKTKQLDYCG